MSAISPRDAILFIVIAPAVLAASSNADAKLDSKVQQIARLLQDNPALLRDNELMDFVMDFTRVSQNPGIRIQRAKWIEGACVDREKGIIKINFKSYVLDQERVQIIENCPKDSGRFDVQSKSLIFSEVALKKISEQDFWNFIQKRRVKKLVIRQGDEQSTEYGHFILRQFREKRPHPVSFLENVTLVIEEKKIEIPKAKVLLCGDYFEPRLSGRFEASNCIDFSKDPVTLNAFNGILSEIETSQKSAYTVEKDYNVAIDFLRFTPPFLKLPEECLGVDLFEELGGKLTDFTPQLWKEWFQAIEDMKKDIPDGVVFGIDPGLSIDAMETIIRDPSNENVSKFLYYDSDVKEKYGAASTSPCLFVRARNVLVGTKDKAIWKQLDLLDELSKKSNRSYKPPTTREVVVSEFLHFLETGERLLSDKPFTWTRTSDHVTIWRTNYPTVVGGFSSYGLRVRRDNFCLEDLGLLPTRKFYLI